MWRQRLSHTRTPVIRIMGEENQPKEAGSQHKPVAVSSRAELRAAKTHVQAALFARKIPKKKNKQISLKQILWADLMSWPAVTFLYFLLQDDPDRHSLQQSGFSARNQINKTQRKAFWVADIFSVTRCCCYQFQSKRKNKVAQQLEKCSSNGKGENIQYKVNTSKDMVFFQGHILKWLEDIFSLSPSTAAHHWAGAPGCFSTLGAGETLTLDNSFIHKPTSSYQSCHFKVGR